MDEPEEREAVGRGGGRCWMTCVLLELARHGAWVAALVFTR
ncbi:hypothetical protein [Actinomadura sp. KC06]|nr:hypothetical protein [Actinomadura sp. KC06]